MKIAPSIWIVGFAVRWCGIGVVYVFICIIIVSNSSILQQLRLCECEEIMLLLLCLKLILYCVIEREKTIAVAINVIDFGGFVCCFFKYGVGIICLIFYFVASLNYCFVGVKSLDLLIKFFFKRVVYSATINMWLLIFIISLIYNFFG